MLRNRKRTHVRNMNWKCARATRVEKCRVQCASCANHWFRNG